MVEILSKKSSSHLTLKINNKKASANINSRQKRQKRRKQRALILNCLISNINKILIIPLEHKI
jgi:hypothetical protein